MLPECLARTPAVAGRHILENRITDLLYVLICHFQTSARLFCVNGAHWHRSRHTVGDPDIFKPLFIFCQFHINRTSQCGDIHGISHGILDIMPCISFIGLFPDQYSRLDLAGLQIYLARLDIKISDRNLTYSHRSGQLNHCIPGKQGGGRIRRSHAVACISADRTDVADLRASHHIHRFTKYRNIFLNQRILRDVRKTGQRTDPKGSVLFQRHAAKIIQSVDTYQLRPGALAFPHLYQHITSAGYDLRFRMFLKQPDRILYSFRFI